MAQKRFYLVIGVVTELGLQELAITCYGTQRLLKVV
jgi:hypothetical protein